MLAYFFCFTRSMKTGPTTMQNFFLFIQQCLVHIRVLKNIIFKLQCCLTVITENVHPQPTISLMTSNGDFEPLTNISVNLQDRGQTTFSNIVILPESALAPNTTTQGMYITNMKLHAQPESSTSFDSLIS
jgi:hypothetical protein